MRAVLPRLTRRPRLAFIGSLGVGLMLALSVGAIASLRQGPPSLDGSQLRRAEAARAALPDTAVMAIFSRPATTDDAIPQAARQVANGFAAAPVPAALNPGNARAATRRALANAGVSNASLYLVPTDKGSLCMVWEPDVYAGGCTQGFTEGTHAIFLSGVTNGRSYVLGVFRDDVTSVAAVVGGERTPVTVGESAFLYEGTSRPDALVLQLSDGTTSTVTTAGTATLSR